MYYIALILHLFGASIWVGGHLYLLIRLMPNFIKKNDVAGFLAFEKSYEPLGIAALITQIITGIYMLSHMLPFSLWQLNALTILIHAKFTWLGLTILTAISARFNVINNLKNNTYNKNTLKIMGVHVLLINIWSVAFVITGVFFRY